MKQVINQSNTVLTTEYFEQLSNQSFEQLRKQMGYTQAELADRMGVSKATISRIESGECPKVYMLACLYVKLIHDQVKRKASQLAHKELD